VTEPTFSVVVGAYNAEATIVPAVRSVLGQTRSDFEVIVVDDGSTDGTAERMREFDGESRVQLLRQPHAGISTARNTAFAVARGRYVSVLDADDVYLPEYLEAHGAALDADDAVGLVWGDSWVLDDSPRRILRRTNLQGTTPDPFPATPPELLHALVRYNFASGGSMARRSALEEAGGWNTNLRAAVDYELWLRIVAHGWRGVRLPGAYMIWRRHAGSLTRSASRMYENHREVARLVAEDWEGIAPETRALAREQLARWDTLARRARNDGRLAVAARGARLLAGRAKRRVLARRLAYETPPPEIARVYPDLTVL
jgi:glycosyltransferase involved in cell wall biosynthesis